MRVRVASAGTGKTTSLVLRYLQLVDGGRPLRRIAGVTFTRAAADELRQRVGAGIEEVLTDGGYLGSAFRPAGEPAAFRRARRELGGAVLSTIHGFMIATLRLSAPVLGLDPDFGVLGEWEAAAMFEEEVRGLQLLAADPGHPRHADAALLGERAGELMMALFGKRSLAPELEPGGAAHERALLALFRSAYERYLARLSGALVAPGEVERRALKALDVPQARARLVARFPVALVDEFQDVNPVQGAFFRRLEAMGVQVEVVGDPKQSIYGFRNADVEVFRAALDDAERAGEVDAPLTDTRRHARAVTDFLNRLTEGLARRSLGFGPREAPPVRAAGAQADKSGQVALHWVVGDERMAALRAREGAVLAEALRRHHADGVPYDAMAVLARSYGGLAVAEEALRGAGVPCVMLQGRGYYDRSEIRDLYHALRVGIRPEGMSLAAFLRGPFGQLDLARVDAVMRAERPLQALRDTSAAVADRIETLQAIVRLPPLEALKRLIRDPLVDGRRYVEFLDERARQNVDALLFEVAARTPRDLEVLLDRLELLSRQAEAGDVPQSGDGVRLLTVHRSKGLEFALTAVFDAGRMLVARTDALYLDPRDGRPRLAGSEGFEEARQARAGARRAGELPVALRRRQPGARHADRHRQRQGGRSTGLGGGAGGDRLRTGRRGARGEHPHACRRGAGAAAARGHRGPGRGAAGGTVADAALRAAPLPRGVQPLPPASRGPQRGRARAGRRAAAPVGPGRRRGAARARRCRRHAGALRHRPGLGSGRRRHARQPGGAGGDVRLRARRAPRAARRSAGVGPRLPLAARRRAAGAGGAAARPGRAAGGGAVRRHRVAGRHRSALPHRRGVDGGGLQDRQDRAAGALRLPAGALRTRRGARAGRASTGAAGVPARGRRGGRRRRRPARGVRPRDGGGGA